MTTTWQNSCAPSVDTGGAVEVEKTIVRGDSWLVRVIVNSVYPDMEVKGAVASAYDDSELFSAVGVTNDGVDFLITFPPVDTASLTTGGDYVYDIQYSHTGGSVVKTVARGKLNVVGQVTT